MWCLFSFILNHTIPNHGQSSLADLAFPGPRLHRAQLCLQQPPSRRSPCRTWEIPMFHRKNIRRIWINNYKNLGQGSPMGDFPDCSLIAPESLAVACQLKLIFYWCNVLVMKFSPQWECMYHITPCHINNYSLVEMSNVWFLFFFKLDLLLHTRHFLRSRTSPGWFHTSAWQSDGWSHLDCACLDEACSSGTW